RCPPPASPRARRRPWPPPSPRLSRTHNPATSSCCPRPARRSTCSTTTSTAATCSRSWSGCSSNAEESHPRHVAVRRGRHAALGRRGDGLLGQRHRGGRPLPRSLLLPQEAALLG